MGIISLEGLEFFAHHGYYTEETKLGNKFTVDVFIKVDFESASEKDDLDRTINYETVYQIIRAEMDKPSKLLENVLYRIQDRISSKFPSIQSLTLSISKLNPPLGGLCQKAKVTITKDFRI